MNHDSSFTQKLGRTPKHIFRHALRLLALSQNMSCLLYIIFLFDPFSLLFEKHMVEIKQKPIFSTFVF